MYVLAIRNAIPAKQERKSIEAIRTSEEIKINGIMDESAWLQAPPASDFIMYSPYNGVSSNYRTEVRVLYDDDAIYLGAMMYDDHPDSIFTELGQRDSEDINADHFYIEISPFNDGLNGEMFKVSASNVQIDNKINSTNRWRREDTWDGVWESRTKIVYNGWTAEIRIPYSALRFSKTGPQVWGINFWREVRRTRETSSWNYVNKEYGATITHLGELKGIYDVKPPLRLSMVPYVSGYIEHRSDEPGTGTSYNGGLDIKVGLSESFTLDATLIPDFGQVQSDDYILNLSPYEVKYNEKRPFFMEGTELFDKGDIFYSRRIGRVPHLVDQVYDMTGENEILTKNPSETGLLNATKISGRTRGGLGIGLFNAVTKTVWATAEDTVTGATRRIMTEPLTNYNIIVFDQTLKNNSYISFANTNVIRDAEKDSNYYTANVTSLKTLLKTPNQLYSISASAALSQKYYSSAATDLGHSINLNIGRTGGKFRTDYNFLILSDIYDPNDMGYLRKNNEIGHSLGFSYNTYQPSGRMMSTHSSIEFNYEQLFRPRAYVLASIEADGRIVFMNYWSLWLHADVTPWGEDDYFEPRTEDMSMFYHRPSALDIGFRGDTDRSKKFCVEVDAGYFRSWSEYGQKGFDFSFQPAYRINKRFSFDYSLRLKKLFNDVGFAGVESDEEIIFGNRNVITLSNTLSGAFIFSANSYLTLRGRHYWSRADYSGNYYALQNDGSLDGITYTGNTDVNTNYINVDLVYTWRFAPGSELSVVWKNAIFSESDVIISDAIRNFRDLLSMPQTNSLSLKILYYLDYQNIRKVFSSK
jgi:hypothetical protein